jgi:hypothetical protein
LNVVAIIVIGYQQRWAMPSVKKPSPVEPVRCEVCRKEVPASEAFVPEAKDYVMYFCGLDCYENWKKPKESTGDG